MNHSADGRQIVSKKLARPPPYFLGAVMCSFFYVFAIKLFLKGRTYEDASSS
jgi:hypothetical protein